MTKWIAFFLNFFLPYDIIFLKKKYVGDENLKRNVFKKEDKLEEKKYNSEIKKSKLKK